MPLSRQPFLVALAAVALTGQADAAWGAPKAKPPPAAHKTQIGEASYFHPKLAGKTTASGKPAAPNKMTAASRTLPLGTEAKVTNVETGKSVAVTVEDRGPYAEGRIIDVSPKAAEKLDMKEDGVAPVKVKPVAVPKTPAK